ncbi:MAG TPA: glycosyltransferase [Allosphingosinicella sp.]|nr:glycosyltransferase [Allosphingosinicella sp.]
MTVSIAIIIPTRNRPDEAMNAVRALAAQTDAPIDIFLCDNSASERPLRDFCRRFDQVTYLRPEREVAMGRNWDWAVREAMRLSSATHFSVHYDRKLSKPGAWAALARVAAARPQALISFPVDHIGHEPPPLRLWQTPWTGRIFSVSTRHVAGLISSGCVTEICHALPVFSNCLVPRRILDAVLDRFGTVCDSTAPDGCFMCRFFTVDEDYVHYDRALGILYSSRRSNGLGYMRGTGGDYPDFVKLCGDGPWLDAAPVPGMSLGSNMLYHEYELVRRATGDRLPPFNRPLILKDLGRELRWTADPALAERFKAMLREAGWQEEAPQPLPARAPEEAAYQRQRMRRIRWRGETPETITGFAFRNDRQALKWALRYPTRKQAGAEHLALLDPKEIADGAEAGAGSIAA